MGISIIRLCGRSFLKRRNPEPAGYAAALGSSFILNRSPLRSHESKDFQTYPRWFRRPGTLGKQMCIRDRPYSCGRAFLCDGTGG